jgi:hypothetical protein
LTICTPSTKNAFPLVLNIFTLSTSRKSLASTHNSWWICRTMKKIIITTMRSTWTNSRHANVLSSARMRISLTTRKTYASKQSKTIHNTRSRRQSTSKTKKFSRKMQ